MRIEYIHTVWLEQIHPNREVKVIFNGRGVLYGKGNELLVFEAPITPFYMAVYGEWMKGMIIEDGGINKFIVFVRNKTEGDKVKIKLVVKGIYSPEIYDGRKYRQIVNWKGKHLHVIQTLPSYKIQSVKPKGYKLQRSRNKVSISWLWKKGYTGEIYLETIKI